MIALPRTRGFSAGNWQILLLTTLKCGPLLACTWRSRSFGQSRQQVLFRQADFIRNRIRQWAVVQDATSAMNK